MKPANKNIAHNVLNSGNFNKYLHTPDQTGGKFIKKHVETGSMTC